MKKISIVCSAFILLLSFSVRADFMNPTIEGVVQKFDEDSVTVVTDNGVIVTIPKKDLTRAYKLQRGNRVVAAADEKKVKQELKDYQEKLDKRVEELKKKGAQEAPASEGPTTKENRTKKISTP